MEQYSFKSITIKTMIIHTISYFCMGVLAFFLMDYTALFAEPVMRNYMRPIDHPMIAAGTMVQVLRGFLFGLVFYSLRETVFARPRGWLTLWLVLVVVGIISTFAPAPGSVEGLVYTQIPLWQHLKGMPEILLQALLLAFLSHYWINHPKKKWLNWTFWMVFILALLMSLAGFVTRIMMKVPV